MTKPVRYARYRYFQVPSKQEKHVTSDAGLQLCAAGLVLGYEPHRAGWMCKDILFKIAQRALNRLIVIFHEVQ